MDAHAGVTNNYLASERAAEMYELYAGGATLRDVGARHNISRERVRQIFDRYGYRVRSLREVAALRRALEEARAKEILAMYTELNDAREVARRLGVSQAAVRDLVCTTQSADPPLASKVRSKFGSPQRRYSEEDLLHCLKAASQELGGVLTTQVYADFTKGRTFEDGRLWPSHQTYRLRFGSWVDALHKAGLRANPRTPIAGQRLFTAAHCTDAVGHLARELGHAPSATEYESVARTSNGALPSLATVRQRCGGWLGALRNAGL